MPSISPCGIECYVFGEVHSYTLFTIAIDFLLAEFVGCKIAILNGCIEYKRFFF
jgi:hypothetical protein